MALIGNLDGIRTRAQATEERAGAKERRTLPLQAFERFLGTCTENGLIASSFGMAFWIQSLPCTVELHPSSNTAQTSGLVSTSGSVKTTLSV